MSDHPSFRLDAIGWFDDASDTPAHDPGVDTGICLYCGHRLSLPVVTPSLMVPGDTRSYFYRLHQACAQRMTPEEETELDGSIIDRIGSNGVDVRSWCFRNLKIQEKP